LFTLSSLKKTWAICLRVSPKLLRAPAARSFG